MTIQTFLLMLFAFSLVSDLITEAIKTLIKDKVNFSSNIIVLVTSVIVGGVGMIIYYIFNDITIGNKEIIYVGLMSLATWLVGTHGYDKIMQTVEQIKGKA